MTERFFSNVVLSMTTLPDLFLHQFFLCTCTLPFMKSTYILIDNKVKESKEHSIFLQMHAHTFEQVNAAESG